jgi:hypothetical protein
MGTVTSAANRCWSSLQVNQISPGDAEPPRVPTLLANSGCWEGVGQPGESGGPASGRCGAGEPGIDADEVDGQRGQHVLQAGLGQAAVAGVVEAAAPGGLGNQALHAAAQPIAAAPAIGGLLGPEPLLGLLLAAGQEGHVAGVGLRAGAAGPVGAGPTVRLAEGGPDDRQAVAAAGRRPGPADLAVGQTTRWASSSIVNRVRSNASWSPALKLVSGGSGPVSWTPWSSSAARTCPTLT